MKDQMERVKIIISIEQGMISSVHASTKEVEVEVWDWDGIETSEESLSGLKRQRVAFRKMVRTMETIY